MNPRHYEIARDVLRRIKDATMEKYERRKAQSGSGTAGANEAFVQTVPEMCSLGEEWCKQAFAGVALPLDLSGADLRDSIFVGRVWSGADFRGAQLEDSQWYFAHVEGADFSGAEMDRTYAMCLCCDGARFHETELRKANLHLYAETEPVDMSRAFLASATIFLSYNSRYVLNGAHMNGCIVRCREINLRTRKAHDLFLGALSAEQEKQINMTISAQDLALSDKQAAAYQAEAGKKSGGCFIATACCGSPTDPLVRDLRRFRDEILMARAPGRMLAAAYARFSPPIADWIRGRTWARSIVRHTIVRPLAWVARRISPS